jgi:integrase
VTAVGVSTTEVTGARTRRRPYRSDTGLGASGEDGDAPSDSGDGAGFRARLLAQFPARRVPSDWPASRWHVEQVLAELTLRHPGTRHENNRQRARSVRAALSWLADQPGVTWQERWRNSGAEAHLGPGWVQVPAEHARSRGDTTASTPGRVRAGVQVLICLDVIRPDMGWLFARRSQRLGTAMSLLRDSEGFAAVAELAQTRYGIGPVTRAAVTFRLAVILAAKGGAIADITVGDYLQAVEVQQGNRAHHSMNGTMTVTYELLRAMGFFPAQAPITVRMFRQRDRLTPAEMIDRRHIACLPVRDLLVDYLQERAPRVDYTTLVNLEVTLARLFWCDLEAHHPGIDSLHLPAEVAAAWKQRMQFKATTTVTDAGEVIESRVPRKTFTDRLIAVRGFYLDIAQWAVQDPARWAAWAVPCPIRPSEINVAVQHRHRKAAMDQRTRERLPVLPLLVAGAERRRIEAAERLAAARATRPGQMFHAVGQDIKRLDRAYATTHRVWAADPAIGKPRDLTGEDTHAFWSWATVEVLRHTGIRIEELLELSHHSLVQYRLPSTGEVVPLLQIMPSKTDTERLLLVSPELADVLAAIITRLRDPRTGAIPTVASFDQLECVWREPQPLLFQYSHGHERRAISRNSISRFLDQALATTGLTDSTGAPLRFTAHDFRRIFVTDAILNGLPPHIAQVICGHADINTTMGYKAAYPAEAIEAHRAFLARRRGLRPSQEYRTPTDTEWQEFLGHFERRKVSLGTCARAFSTSCIHEHACLRCPLLWPDPAQRPRLIEIRDNLIARIAEAEHEGWLGEVEGLRVSLAGANDKLTQMDRPTTGTVHLGMPALPGPIIRTDEATP